VNTNGEYVVRRGDSIERIARTLAVAPDDLLRANGIGNKNLIYAGQTLRIPTATMVAVAAASSERDDVVTARVEDEPVQAEPISVAMATDLPAPVAVAAVAPADVVIPFLPADHEAVSSPAELAELADRVIVSDE